MAAQLEGILGRPPEPALAAELHERCGGNPLFAEELLSAHRDPGGEKLPARLADALRVRLRRVPEPARRLLPYAAAIGRPAGASLLGAASGTDEPELSAALRDAVDHHLLVHDRERDAFTFRHDVVREAVYADLLPGERAPVHGAVAQAIGDSGAHAELAVHWRAAGRREQALRASVAAGLEAGDARAFAEALRHLRAALELWPDQRRRRRRPRPGRAARPRCPISRATPASTRRRSPGARRRSPSSASRPRRNGRPGSSSASGACSRSRTTAVSPPIGPRCSGCPAATAPAARACWARRHMPSGLRTATRRRVGARRRRSTWRRRPAPRARRPTPARFSVSSSPMPGDPQAGAEHLRTAIAELEGLGRPEDLLSAHLYLRRVAAAGG